MNDSVEDGQTGDERPEEGQETTGDGPESDQMSTKPSPDDDKRPLTPAPVQNTLDAEVGDKSQGCCGGCCKKCIGRIPYGTLIATVLCCSGVSVFLGTFYRAMALTLRMFEEVFKFQFAWLTDLHLVFIGVGTAMGIISLLVLFVSFLATGATREQVYQGWKSRVGGRISCIVFIVIKYILFWIWLLMLVCMVVLTFVMSLWWGMCNNLKYEPNPDNRCVDLRQFRFLFPNQTDINYLRICEGRRKTFCTDCVEQAELMYILALLACFLVVISLVHYLICLAANYARIQEKYQELEMHYLQETEMGSLPKDRF